MKKKTPLLNESTTRKFMKLANLGPIGGSFLKEAFGDEDDEEKDEDQNEELKEVSDEDLIAECKKRGINVDEGKPSKAGPVAGE